VGCHTDKVSAYLRGEAVFPVTLELDLTSACTYSCLDCPSTRAPAHHSLSWEFLDRLFGLLAGRTTGLLLTGGEATMAPLFPRAVAAARERGFREIAVVTNGSLLDRPEVAEALLRHVTTIRLSLYGWGDGMCSEFDQTLLRMEALRRRIDREGSPLRIGVSALTSADRVGMLEVVADRARSAGAHWAYFHPLCTKWQRGCPSPARQGAVADEVRRLQARGNGDFQVFLLADRYDTTPVEFEGYHAAHFLMVVGADGRNYLAPEVKYQPGHVIGDLSGGPRDGFLWERERMKRIADVRSQTYPAIRSRHRGVLYSGFLEGLKRGDPAEAQRLAEASRGFVFPHIL
jgi:MoaA/NifB/PqqE/SkfB family radical SAM enzyme